MSELMDKIKNLREITGAGFVDCKKALESNHNNIEISIDFLRKKGLAKANKKSSREAKEGAVGVFSGKNLDSIILINTETDFAAKNEVFLTFMNKIGNYLINLDDENISLDQFNSIEFDDRSIDNHFKDIIAKIGENIILTKIVCIPKKNDEILTSYVHNTYKENIGKIGVVLRSKVDKINDEAKKFGKNICMHIAASKPLALKVADLNKDLIDRERDVQLESIKSLRKPENIIEKILDGKMKKFYSENTLLNQSFIMDTDKTITEIIFDFSQSNKFEILTYDSISLGV